MSAAGKTLTGLFAFAGFPLAGLVWWYQSAEIWVAVLLLGLYECVTFMAATAVSASQEVVRRRFEQLANFLDLAAGRKVSRYTRVYLRWVVQRSSYINAKDLTHTPGRLPELDAIYVDVGLAPGWKSSRVGGLLPQDPIDHSGRQSIRVFLNNERRNVCAIIGAPGSGKSTLLRHTALHIARHGKRQRRRIPVVVLLRDHATLIASDVSPTLTQLIRSSVGELGIAEPIGWWEEQLRGGNCVVMLDGLDEVARSEDRAAVTEWIEGQIAIHSGNDFVVSSRPHGYRTAAIPQAIVLQMLPLNTAQRDRFVHAWCRSAEFGAGIPEEEATRRAREEAVELLGKLDSAPDLQEIAVNPLLLTMIVMVHRERRVLPERRADLYDQVCDVMLWRRQETKKMAVDPPGPVRRRILGALAYLMMADGMRDYPRERVLAVLESELQSSGAEISPEDLLIEIVDSSGLLVERERNRFAFTHLTIGEYLAAEHIHTNGLLETLIDAVDNPWWRETTLLYITNAKASAIIDECLDRGTSTSLSLAFGCIRNHGLVEPGARERLDQVRLSAFGNSASPVHRRLISGALTIGHLSRLVTVDGSRLVCPNPVTKDLYWLFCKETGNPYPDGATELDYGSAELVAGVSGSDAQQFVNWVNTVAAQESAATYRLLTEKEAEHITSSGRANGWFDQSTTAIWTLTDEIVPRLWSPAENDPCSVTVTEMFEAVETDMQRASFPRVLDLDRAFGCARALACARDIARAGELAHDLTRALARDIGRAGDLVRTLDVALARDIARDLNLDLDLDPAPSLERDLTRALALDLDPDLARDRALDLARARDHALSLDLDLARDHPLSITFDRDIDYVRDVAGYLARTRAGDLARALDRHASPSSDIARARDLARDLAHAPDSDLDLVLFSDVQHIELMGASAGRLRSVIDKYRSKLDPLGEYAEPVGALAVETLAAAGVKADFRTVVNLDELYDKLQTGCRALVKQDASGTRNVWAVAVAQQLAASAKPCLTRREPFAAIDSALIRIPALLLAAEAQKRDMEQVGEAFRAVVAGITLLEKRAAGQAPLGVILLARE